MTSIDHNKFYVTLLRNASQDIYDQNTHADFTVNLAQPKTWVRPPIGKWESVKIRVLRLPKVNPLTTLL